MSQQVSRRAVTRGAAWTVPLVAVGVAAPAFAVSPIATPTPVMTGCQCSSANKKYRLSLTFANPTADSYSVTSIVVAAAGDLVLFTTPTTGTVNANGSSAINVTFFRANNSATSSVTVTYTIKNNTTNETSNVTVGPAIVAWFDCANGLC